MKQSKSLFTPAQALHNVLNPWSRPFSPALLRLRPFPAPSPQYYHHYGPAKLQQRQQERNTVVPRGRSDLDRRSNIENFGPKDDSSGKPQIPQDEFIKAYRVHVVQADGKLSEPMILQDALDARQRDRNDTILQYLRQVQPAGGQTVYPICRYFDKQEEREKELARKKAAKASKIELKQLQLNWTIGENDLGHRLRQMTEFLRKGCKVEVVIGAPRKKGWANKRTDDPNIANALVSKVRSAALEVDGTKEKVAMRGSLGKEVELSFEGPRNKEAAG